MSVVAGLIPVTQKASNVCAYCRVRKQRCDRTLPRCQRCAMKGRHCDYTPFKEPNRQEDDDPRPLVHQYDTCSHADLTSRGASELLHATAAWVSSSGAPAAASKLSEVVHDILDLADVDVPQALAEFGPCIQQWCPVVPTTYLQGGVDDLAQQGQRRDKLRHPLLLLCLWLVTRRTCAQEDHTTKCQLYRTLKQMVPLLQPEEAIGIETLQISMLLTIYEVGHGMSKQAFQTISTSVSMLKLLDLDAPDPTTKPMLSWLTSSVLMLDNTLSITALPAGFPLTLLPSDPSASPSPTLSPQAFPHPHPPPTPPAHEKSTSAPPSPYPPATYSPTYTPSSTTYPSHPPRTPPPTPKSTPASASSSTNPNPTLGSTATPLPSLSAPISSSTQLRRSIYSHSSNSNSNSRTFYRPQSI